jgi:hypothetical protein
MEKANTVLDAAKELTRLRDKVLREIATKPGRLAIGLAYVLESLERSAYYASDLAEIAIDRAVEVSGRPADLTPVSADPIPETVERRPVAAP